MPSRRSRNDLVLLSADDPRAVVNWLCERFGLQAVLQAVAEFRPAAQQGEAAPAKRAYKKRGPKKGSKRGGGGAGKSSKKGGAKRGRPARAQSEAESGQ